MIYKSKKKKQAEKKAKVDAFLEEYKQLSAKHGIDIGTQLQYTPQGVIPQLVFKFIEEKKKDE